MKDREKITEKPIIFNLECPECMGYNDHEIDIFVHAEVMALESELTRLSSRVEELEKENHEAVELVRLAKRHLNIRKVTIVKNLKQILTDKFGSDTYITHDDDLFFEKYSGSTVNIYGDDGEYFIVDDDNYVLIEECFLNSIKED